MVAGWEDPVCWDHAPSQQQLAGRSTQSHDGPHSSYHDRGCHLKPSVLFVLENYVPHHGGVEVVFKNLCEGLAEAGHRITVLTHHLPGTKREELVSGVRVVRVKCLANCTRGPTAALRSNGSWTYVFGGLALDGGAVLVEGARLLACAADGILPWRCRPEPLKRGLVARVPPLDFEEERE